MAKKFIHLVFPQELIKKPIIYTIAKRYDLVPNIRRAKVTDTVGEVTLEISGKKENIDKAFRYLTKKGITVEHLPGNILEP